MREVTRRRLGTLMFLVLTAAPFGGCSAPARLPAVPKALQGKAEIPGMPGVRYRFGQLQALLDEGRAGVERERAVLQAEGKGGDLPPAYYLAISGGGDNGAFGAGLLNGWTTVGNRPTFKLVTGVSTGGLIAPFAFLGASRDSTLKEMYTTIKPHDILEKRNILAAVINDAMADNRPLWHQLEKQVDRAMLDAIAAEYAKGRILLVGTTDLDARQGVIWNLTKIAASHAPGALDLFRNIMMASAAIPGAFPPTMIEVEADGKRYQEMHVDGGCSAQVFVYPPAMNLAQISKQQGMVRTRHVYVIRNARLDPDWADVERRTLTIAERAVGSLIHTQGMGDLYRIYATTQRDGVDFNLARIPDTFQHEHKEEFDTDYMKALYALAYDAAVKGYPWEKGPPDFSIETPPAEPEATAPIAR